MQTGLHSSIKMRSCTTTESGLRAKLSEMSPENFPCYFVADYSFIFVNHSSWNLFQKGVNLKAYVLLPMGRGGTNPHQVSNWQSTERR